MTRKILLFIVLCFCISANAQRVDKPGEAYDCFCDVHADGQNFKVFLLEQDKILVDKDGKKIKFKNITEIMSYLSKRGWIFVDSYGDKKSSNNDLHVIMKKIITSDEQALDNIRFEK